MLQTCICPLVHGKYIFLERLIVLLLVYLICACVFYVFVQLRIFLTLAEPVVGTGLHRYTSTTFCFVELASL